MIGPTKFTLPMRVSAFAIATCGAALLIVACISDEASPLSNTPKGDASDSDAPSPPNSDAGDSGTGQQTGDAGDAGDSGTGQPGQLPATIDGLILWLDAADTNSVTRVQPGSNETVVRWLDKSPSSPPRHFAQDDRERAPLFEPGGLNRAAIRFVQQQRHYLVGPSLSGAAGAEAFVVFRTSELPYPGGGANQVYGLWHFGTNNSGHPTFFSEQGYQTTDSFGSTADHVLPVARDAFWSPQIFGVISTRDEWSASLNGTQLLLQTGEGFGFRTPNSFLGATNHGGGADPVSYFNGLIAEVVIYNRKLPAADHKRIQSYLSAKWAISVADAG